MARQQNHNSDPSDVSHFDRIDRQLFERLHEGSLDPLTIVLTDGRVLHGQPAGVATGAQGGADGDARWGRVIITTDSGNTDLYYDRIQSIS